MTRLKSRSLLRDVRALFGTGTPGGLGDNLLLERFISRRDEVAFEELMARHGPLVLSICRRSLHVSARHSLTDPSIATAGTSRSVARLVQEVLRIMLVTRIQAPAVLVLAVGVAAFSAWPLLCARPAGPLAQARARREPASSSAAAQSQKPATDRYGDPLPAGAVIRLGTVRFRQPPSIWHIVYSPDGQLAATSSGQQHIQDGKTVATVSVDATLRIWDVATMRLLRQSDW